MVKIIPSVDSADFTFPPQVVAALLAQLPPAEGGIAFGEDPDGVPVLVLANPLSYTDTDPDGTPVLVIGA